MIYVRKITRLHKDSRDVEEYEQYLCVKGAQSIN